MRSNTFEFEGETYTFNIENENDAIQKCHAAGELFDFNELKVMAEYINDGDFIVDIGANVGNHTIYLAKRFSKSTVMPFEPNQHAEKLLRANIASNTVGNVVMDGIGFGISDVERKAMSWRGGPNNLGGSKVVDLIPENERTSMHRRHIDETGNLHEVKLLNGDEVLFERAPQFVKIDVEGHEFSVLRGLQQTIAAHKPVIFIEVQNEDIENFTEWLETNRYEQKWVDTHYAKVTNFLVTPINWIS